MPIIIVTIVPSSNPLFGAATSCCCRCFARNGGGKRRCHHCLAIRTIIMIILMICINVNSFPFFHLTFMPPSHAHVSSNAARYHEPAQNFRKVVWRMKVFACQFKYRCPITVKRRYGLNSSRDSTGGGGGATTTCSVLQ